MRLKRENTIRKSLIISSKVANLTRSLYGSLVRVYLISMEPVPATPTDPVLPDFVLFRDMEPLPSQGRTYPYFYPLEEDDIEFEELSDSDTEPLPLNTCECPGCGGASNDSDDSDFD